MLKGSIVALITPFTKNNNISFKKLYELIEIQYFSQTDGIVILGTTSEAATLNEYECDQIVDFVIKINNKRMKIVVGVIDNVTERAIKKAQKYEKMGADYLLVSPPYYNKTNSSGLIKHFSLIANSVKIPIIIYNVPSRIGFNINIDDFIKLKEIKNIVGVKECGKDITHIMDLANICDDNFSLYCGNDDLSYLFLSLGAKGLINVYGNIEPKVMKNIIHLFDENEYLARKYFFKYYELFKTIFIETNPIPIKALMNYVGLNVGLYRLPLDKISEVNLEKLIKIYKIVNS